MLDHSKMLCQSKYSRGESRFNPYQFEKCNLISLWKVGVLKTENSRRRIILYFGYVNLGNWHVNRIRACRWVLRKLWHGMLTDVVCKGRPSAETCKLNFLILHLGCRCGLMCTWGSIASAETAGLYSTALPAPCGQAIPKTSSWKLETDANACNGTGGLTLTALWAKWIRSAFGRLLLASKYFGSKTNTVHINPGLTWRVK